MCCPAGEHINIEGKKTSYKQLSHHLNPPPLTQSLHGDKEEGGEEE